MLYLIATSEIPNHRYEFFAKEMGISKNVFKTIQKLRRELNSGSTNQKRNNSTNKRIYKPDGKKYSC